MTGYYPEEVYCDKGYRGKKVHEGLQCKVLIPGTKQKVTAVQNRSPPVNNQTRRADSAAIGNANRKPIATIAIKPMIIRMMSIQRSVAGSVGITICRAVKNDKRFTSK